MNYYGDKLNDKERIELLKEIASFDKQATLDEIEENAVGGPKAEGYWEWLEHNGKRTAEGTLIEPYEANPDMLSEEAVLPLGASSDTRLSDAQKEIAEVLTIKEMQVWRLIMRQGLSYGETAAALGISKSAVQSRITHATEKVRKHFNESSK